MWVNDWVEMRRFIAGVLCCQKQEAGDIDVVVFSVQGFS